VYGLYGLPIARPHTCKALSFNEVWDVWNVWGPTALSGHGDPRPRTTRFKQKCQLPPDGCRHNRPVTDTVSKVPEADLCADHADLLDPQPPALVHCIGRHADHEGDADVPHRQGSRNQRNEALAFVLAEIA
jgi:hypothetical protein